MSGVDITGVGITTMTTTSIIDPDPGIGGIPGRDGLLRTEKGIGTGHTDEHRRALDDFFAASQSRAYHVALGALWDHEMALDVVQDSMLRFMEYYGRKPPAQWPALFRSVLNSRINDQRRRRLLGSTTRRLLSLTGLGLSRDSTEDRLQEAELAETGHERGFSQPEAGRVDEELGRHIRTALGRLAERQRQVFLLREQLGLSIRETAETLGCSENSIKQHHFRALRALRKQLAEVWSHEQT